MRGFILLANGFEESEVVVTIDILRRAKIIIDMVSVTNELQLVSTHEVKLIADKRLIDIKPTEYDFLVIPGGLKSVLTLHNRSDISEIILDFFEKNKLIASICAGPSLVSKLGIFKGHKFTCFPGFEKYHEDGIYLPSEDLIVDGNFVTARSMANVYSFALAIVGNILGKEEENKIRKLIAGKV